VQIIPALIVSFSRLHKNHKHKTGLAQHVARPVHSFQFANVRAACREFKSLHRAAQVQSNLIKAVGNSKPGADLLGL
jgi:hypothetical protein